MSSQHHALESEQLGPPMEHVAEDEETDSRYAQQLEPVREGSIGAQYRAD